MQAALEARLGLNEAQSLQLRRNLQNPAYAALVEAIYESPYFALYSEKALRHLATEPPENVNRTKLATWLADGDPYLLPLAVQAGVDIRNYPLNRVVKKGFIDLLIQLFALGTDPDPVGGYQTPLIVAIQHQKRDVVMLLLSMGVDPNNTGGVRTGSRTPLQVALLGEDINLANLLLMSGAEWNGWSPYFIAALPPDRILWFLDNTSYDASREGDSVLNSVARKYYSQEPRDLGYAEVIRRLLERGVDPEAAGRFTHNVLREFAAFIR